MQSLRRAWVESKITEQTICSVLVQTRTSGHSCCSVNFPRYGFASCLKSCTTVKVWDCTSSKQKIFLVQRARHCSSGLQKMISVLHLRYDSLSNYRQASRQPRRAMFLCISEVTTANVQLFRLGLIMFKTYFCFYNGSVLVCRTRLGGWMKLILLVSFHWKFRFIKTAFHRHTRVISSDADKNGSRYISAVVKTAAIPGIAQHPNSIWLRLLGFVHLEKEWIYTDKHHHFTDCFWVLHWFSVLYIGQFVSGASLRTKQWFLSKKPRGHLSTQEGMDVAVFRLTLGTQHGPPA